MSQRLLQASPAPAQSHRPAEKVEMRNASSEARIVRMSTEPAAGLTVEPRYPIPSNFEYRIKPPEFDFL